MPPLLPPPLQGLGELYAEDFVRATSGNVAQDKEEPLRQQARALFKALCAKLDALTHFHYAPKPVVEELEVGGLAGPGVQGVLRVVPGL
jgi:U3 small nucleolar ribonucleoprotein component